MMTLNLDCKLHLDYHITQITNKAFQMYGFVMRVCSPFKKCVTYMTLYKALVRSQVEYASVVWNPIYGKYNQKLEVMQRKFLKSVAYRCFNSKLSYESLLSKFCIPSLC